MRRFVYRGTDVLGLPKACKIMVSVANAGRPGNIKLLDFTNSTTICEWLNITSVTPVILSITNLQNLPSDEAVFEIQGQANGNKVADVMRISTFIMEF
jgi:hypothetical protein